MGGWVEEEEEKRKRKKTDLGGTWVLSREWWVGGWVGG